MPFTSIGNDYVLDQRLIFLGWREKGFRKGYPFKFNRICLEDSDFNEAISNQWKQLSSREKMPYFLTFREKMESIWKFVKDW